MNSYARCVHCGVYVLWALNTHGSATPVDYRPTGDGDIVLIHRPTYDRPFAYVVGPADTLSPDAKALPRHTSHLNTCPERART